MFTRVFSIAATGIFVCGLAGCLVEPLSTDEDECVDELGLCVVLAEEFDDTDGDTDGVINANASWNDAYRRGKSGFDDVGNHASGLADESGGTEKPDPTPWNQSEDAVRPMRLDSVDATVCGDGAEKPDPTPWLSSPDSRGSRRWEGDDTRGSGDDTGKPDPTPWRSDSNGTVRATRASAPKA